MAASLSTANFVDPWEFRPERWLGHNKEDILEAAQPFSLGPRGCLGRKYVELALYPPGYLKVNIALILASSLAWMELHMVLAKLLFTYELELVNTDLDWHRDSRMATLWQKPELMVRVKPRKQ